MSVAEGGREGETGERERGKGGEREGGKERESNCLCNVCGKRVAKNVSVAL